MMGVCMCMCMCMVYRLVLLVNGLRDSSWEASQFLFWGRWDSIWDFVWDGVGIGTGTGLERKGGRRGSCVC